MRRAIDMRMTPDDLEDRCTNLAREVFALCADVRTIPGGKNAADQLQKCSSSAASNYSAARRARSRSEFIAKLGLTAEEANETVGWIQYVEDTHLADSRRVAPLLDEAVQLRAILAASYRTARANHRRRQITK